MFETVRRHPLKVLSHVIRDPMDSFEAFKEEFLSKFEDRNFPPYQADPEWEPKLKHLLNITGDESQAEFWRMWEDVVASLRARGLKVGPASFYDWNDGDAGFVRAIWTLIRHLRPEVIVETGVAHGMTSRFILEALERNGTGRLWSVDLPPVNPEMRQEVGIAVDAEALKRRWTYVAGTSRRRLPGLLRELGQLDLFIHDSRHSERNLAFELDVAWRHLKPGGVMIADDIDINSAFRTFSARFPQHPAFVCTAEPIKPDMRRFNEKGLFGIIVKSA